MAPATSSRSPDVLWSSDRNAATKALARVTLGYRDTLINLLCRDINETPSRFGDACVVTTNRTANMSEEISLVGHPIPATPINHYRVARSFVRPVSVYPSEYEITIAKLAEFRNLNWIRERRFLAPSI